MKLTVRYFQAGQSAISEEVVEAVSESALRAQWAAEPLGRSILSIQTGQPSNYKTTQSASLKAADYPLFCRELKTLLHAGMTVVEAIDTLAATATVSQGNIARPLYQQLSAGQSLSQALSQLANVPDVLLAAVRSGERTSNLGEALDDYLAYHGMVADLRSKVVSAAIYPALVSVLGISITLFILMIVMPNFARMYDNLRGSAKGLTAVVIGVSSFMNAHRSEVFAGLIVLVLLLVWWIRTGRAKRALLALAWAIKPLRLEIEHFQLAMLYQTLHLLIKGGYPVTEAMTIAGSAALNQQMQAGLRAALARIEQGKPIAQTLFDRGLCSEVDRRLMAAAERNGDFYRTAEVVSGLHREHFETFVGRATRIIEPALIFLVALMVGSVVVMMYLPVFEMSTQLR